MSYFDHKNINHSFSITLFSPFNGFSLSYAIVCAISAVIWGILYFCFADEHLIKCFWWFLLLILLFSCSEILIGFAIVWNLGNRFDKLFQSLSILCPIIKLIAAVVWTLVIIVWWSIGRIVIYRLIFRIVSWILSSYFVLPWLRSTPSSLFRPFHSFHCLDVRILNTWFTKYFSSFDNEIFVDQPPSFINKRTVLWYYRPIILKLLSYFLFR